MLCIPQVAVVHSRHQNVGEQDTDVLVELEPEGRPEAGTADEVPVEAPREKAHALVVTASTEDVAENKVRVIR